MDKNPFLKYVMKAEKGEVFHSSAYGKAQNGAAMGVASTESFAKRKMMEQNRQRVRGYRDAEVVSQARAGAPRARTYDGAMNNGNRIGMSGAGAAIDRAGSGIGRTGVGTGANRTGIGGAGVNGTGMRANSARVMPKSIGISGKK